MVSALPLGTPAGGAIVMLFDITEFKRLEKIKADFVANVSHELKTPLTAPASSAPSSFILLLISE